MKKNYLSTYIIFVLILLSLILSIVPAHSKPYTFKYPETITIDKIENNYAYFTITYANITMDVTHLDTPSDYNNPVSFAYGVGGGMTGAGMTYTVFNKRISPQANKTVGDVIEELSRTMESSWSGSIRVPYVGSPVCAILGSEALGFLWHRAIAGDVWGLCGGAPTPAKCVIEQAIEIDHGLISMKDVGHTASTDVRVNCDNDVDGYVYIPGSSPAQVQLGGGNLSTLEFNNNDPYLKLKKGDNYINLKSVMSKIVKSGEYNGAVALTVMLNFY